MWSDVVITVSGMWLRRDVIRVFLKEKGLGSQACEKEVGKPRSQIQGQIETTFTHSRVFTETNISAPPFSKITLYTQHRFQKSFCLDRKSTRLNSSHT